MKACVYADLETVEVHDIPKPVAAPDEALIKVSRAGICGTDLHIYLGHMDQRVTKPLVMGHEMCGELVEIPDGSGPEVGDRVVVEPTVFCGKCAACKRGNTHVCQNLNFLGIDSPGAFQEFWNVPVDRLHAIPQSLSDNAAAMIEPLAVAVHDVRRAPVELGDQAVVIGGGPIGLLVAHAARRPKCTSGGRRLGQDLRAERVQRAGEQREEPPDVRLGLDVVLDEGAVADHEGEESKLLGRPVGDCRIPGREQRADHFP